MSERTILPFIKLYITYSKRTDYFQKDAYPFCQEFSFL